MPGLTLRGAMTCHEPPGQCRDAHIAPRLRGAEKDGTDWESKCPSCGHGGFRISRPGHSHYRHIWACACRLCRCDKGAIRTAFLNLGVMPACVGNYGVSGSTGNDPAAAARLEQAVRDILSLPGLKPSDMRLILAEALGDKVPEDSRSFVPWAMGIGIGRRQAFEAATRWCRPSVASSSPEGGVADT